MQRDFDLPVGIYGAGHLCESFLAGLQQIAISPVAIYNRTPERIDPLRVLYQSLVPARNLFELVSRGGLVFLFVPARAALNLGDDIVELANSCGTTFVSCVNGLSLSLIEGRYPGTPIIKAVPNVLWRILRGITLVQIGQYVVSQRADNFRELVSRLSVLQDVGSEDDFDRLGAFTSCGPGLFAELILQLNLGFDARTETERELLLRTITSTGIYMLQSGRTPEFVVHEVANPGGLTEVGTKALADSMPGALAYLRESMARKIASRRDGF